MATIVIRLYVLCEVQVEAEERAEHQACNTTEYNQMAAIK
jgi:hypothetical protein